MAQVTVIGVHPLDCDEELFDAALTQRHGLIALDTNAERRERAESGIRADLRSIVLIELRVVGRDRRMYLGDFGQSPSGVLGPGDPVADQEAILSDDGTRRVADYLDLVQSEDVRLTFYLRAYRRDLPILTTYGPVAAPPPTAMPLRLRRLAPYRPTGPP